MAGEKVDILPLVCGDMANRAVFGLTKYGKPLHTFNGRKALQDAYEESQDQTQYLKQALLERDAQMRAFTILLDAAETLLKNAMDPHPYAIDALMEACRTVRSVCNTRQVCCMSPMQDGMNPPECCGNPDTILD